MSLQRAWRWNSVDGDGRRAWMTPAPEVALFADRLRRRNARLVCDVGTGLGRHAAYLASVGFDLAGCDLSTEAVCSTRSELLQCGGSHAIVRADARALPFATGIFGGGHRIQRHLSRDAG